MDALKHIGFDVLIFMAALQNIPSSVYEAARVDGATQPRRDHRVVRAGVAADDHQAARLLVVGIGVAGCAAAELPSRPTAGVALQWSMLFVPSSRTEFLGRRRPRSWRKQVRRMSCGYRRRDEVERLVPSPAELAVADQRPSAGRVYTTCRSGPSAEHARRRVRRVVCGRPQAAGIDLQQTPQPTPQYGQTLGTSRAISGSGWGFGSSAPVGQTDTHGPHDVQIESMTGWSTNAAMRASRPVPATAIAPMCCTSWHASTQRPQRMHLAGSRWITLLISTTSLKGCVSPLNFPSSTPYS
jgi:hypothetical protein